jgi:hypothetical protein
MKRNDVSVHHGSVEVSNAPMSVVGSENCGEADCRFKTERRKPIWPPRLQSQSPNG